MLITAVPGLGVHYARVISATVGYSRVCCKVSRIRQSAICCCCCAVRWNCRKCFHGREKTAPGTHERWCLFRVPYFLLFILVCCSLEKLVNKVIIKKRRPKNGKLIAPFPDKLPRWMVGELSWRGTGQGLV